MLYTLFQTLAPGQISARQYGNSGEGRDLELCLPAHPVHSERLSRAAEADGGCDALLHAWSLVVGLKQAQMIIFESILAKEPSYLCRLETCIALIE